MIVPGRILIIDDAPLKKEKAKIDKLIQELNQTGETVHFSSSIPANDFLYRNVRLLIIDYLLTSDPDKSLEMIATIIEKITKRTPFFVVVVWSKVAKGKKIHINDEVKHAYSVRTNTELKAKMLEPFGKRLSTSQLVKKLKKELACLPECALLYEIEAALENARDKTISDIFQAGEMPVIVEALRQEVGDVSLNREITDLFLKVLSRHSAPTPSLKKCLAKLTKRPTSIDITKYGKINNLQSFYFVNPQERTWTGDILVYKQKNHSIILSPECDFAQKKTTYLKLASAVRFEDEDLMNSTKLNILAKKIGYKDNAKALQVSILKNEISERYYALTYLKGSDDKIFHLIIDFQSVNSLRYRKNGITLEKAGYKRICRIDKPLIHHLLQAFSVYSSRIGVNGTPKVVVSSAKARLSANAATRVNS